MHVSSFQIGNWHVEPALGRLRRGDTEVSLQKQAMELLCFFAAHPGEVLSLDELMAGVWGDTVVSDNVIYWNVNQLRTALATGGDGQEDFIETLPRRGYRLVAEVRAASDEPGAPPRHRRRAALVLALAGMLVLAGAWFLQASLSGPAAPPTLAVLPFVNLGEDPADGSLADGVTEELLNTVAQLRNLRVIARTSAFYYKDRNLDLREVGEALGADHIVEGSVRRAGERVRVTVQLIDAANGHHRWSQTYDRRVDDLLDVQRDVAVQVARALEVQLTPGQVARLASDPGGPPESVALIERARGQLRERRGADGQLAAIALLDEALAIDPDNLQALHGQTMAYAMLRSIHSFPFEDSVAPARAGVARMEAAGYAATAEYQLLEALVSRLEMSTWGVTAERVRAIDRAYQRAIELDPNEVTGYLSYAIHARRLGRIAQARQLLDEAALRDPLDVGVNLQYARVLAASGEPEAALNRARALVRHHPDSPLAYQTLGETLAHQGRFAEALHWLEQAPGIEGSISLMYFLRMTYFAIGDADSAVDWIHHSAATPEETALVAGIRGDWEWAAAELRRLLRNQESADRRAVVWAADAALLAGELDTARHHYQAAAPELLESAATLHQQNYRIALKLAAVLAWLGEQERADQLLAELERWLRGHHRLGFEGHAISLAETLALMGRPQAALDELEKVFEAGWIQLYGPWPDSWWGQPSPLLISLHGEARFRRLSERARDHLAAEREALAAGALGGAVALNGSPGQPPP